MTYQQSLLDALSAAPPRLDWAAVSDLAISGHARGVLVGIKWERPDLAGYRLNFARLPAPGHVLPAWLWRSLVGRQPLPIHPLTRPLA